MSFRIQVILMLILTAVIMSFAGVSGAETLLSCRFDAGKSTPDGWHDNGVEGTRWEKSGRLGGRSIYVGNVGHPKDAPTWISSSVDLKGCRSLQVSGWLASGAVWGSDDTYGLEVRSVFKDGSGKAVGYKRTLKVLPSPLGERRTRNTESSKLRWEYQSALLDVPEGAVTAEFEFRHSMGGGASLSSGEAWLDDLMITSAEGP
ncbi:MAG: hypothetical protein PHT33_06960, partial [bacterium]|nr:hypothetical protein [bacterium]